jgi:hypothetical protein
MRKRISLPLLALVLTFTVSCGTSGPDSTATADTIYFGGGILLR